MDNRACKGQIFRIFASLSPNYGRKSHGHGDISILLFKSIGRTRPVDERAERFLNQFGGHHWVIDAEKLGLGELDESVAEYFNSLLFHPISKQFISAMADVRMHPMTYRRYMWKFDY